MVKKITYVRVLPKAAIIYINKQVRFDYKNNH